METLTNPTRDSEPTGSIGRRTLLKGAAAGVTGSALTGTASAWENVIVFRSVSDEAFEYRVTVTGKIRLGDRANPENDVIVDENTARGSAAGGGEDNFEFTGDIKDLDLEGPGRVFVNGELIRDTTEKDLPNTVTIQARGESVDYEFIVSGSVEKGELADSDDEIIDSNVVRGSVGGQGKDDYRYSGRIAFESTDDPLRVCLDLNER